MANSTVNRTAELAGELAYRYRKGSVMAGALLENMLSEAGAGADAATVSLAGEALTSLWHQRLTNTGTPDNPSAQLHPTELGRLQPADFAPDASGQGRPTGQMTDDQAAAHAYRQAAYAAFGLPVHPDAERALSDASSHRTVRS